MEMAQPRKGGGNSNAKIFSRAGRKKRHYSPAINVSKNSVRFGLLVVGSDVRLDPVDDVILKSTLNHLVKKVHGNEFVDVRPRKTSREWLTGIDR
jgi:hypothetical protein